MQIKCPKCKAMHEYSVDNPYRPFCSERCKEVDLGQWANEEYAIPSNAPVNTEDLSRSEHEPQSEHEPDGNKNRGQGDLH